MFSVETIHEVSASHKLEGYDGKCKNLHGHNYIIRARVASVALVDPGFVVDFSAIGKLVMQWDHTHLNDQPEFSSCNSTAEAMAKALWIKLQDFCDHQENKPKVLEVSVEEDRDSVAVYNVEG